MDPFLLFYFLGIGAGIIIYFFLTKLIKPNLEKYNFRRIFWTIVIGMTIVLGSVMLGWTGMVTAMSGLGIITLGIMMCIVKIIKKPTIH